MIPRQIRLSDGTVITRSWQNGWCFEITNGRGEAVTIRPKPIESKAIAMLFNGDDLTEDETKRG